MTERTAVATSSAQTPDDSSTMNNMATLMLSLSLIYLLPLLPPADKVQVDSQSGSHDYEAAS